MTKILGDRNEELKKVIRYSTASRKWEPMFYKPDLLIHTKRVSWITQELTKYLYTINPDIFSKELANELAIFHDDTEIITGDIVSLEKETFSKEELEDYKKQNLQAIETLHAAYNSLTDFDYRELLIIDQQKTSLEYLIVCYADKLDAHMEICHEIFAGNELCITPLTRWGLDILPHNYTKNKIIKLERKLSEAFGVNLRDTHPLFYLSEELDYYTAWEKGTPYNKESIQEKTGYTLTDYRRELHFMYGNTREKEYLYTQKEFT